MRRRRHARNPEAPKRGVRFSDRRERRFRASSRNLLMPAAPSRHRDLPPTAAGAGFTVNGESRPLPEPPSVGGALRELGLSARPVAVELNGELVRRTDHDATRIAVGDRVEIMSFVGGG